MNGNIDTLYLVLGRLFLLSALGSLGFLGFSVYKKNKFLIIIASIITVMFLICCWICVPNAIEVLWLRNY